MTAKEDAQEVQKDTSSAPDTNTEQAAAVKEAAAKITGKPAADLTEEEAEAALFEEIGITTPKTPAEKAHDIIIKNMELSMQQDKNKTDKKNTEEIRKIQEHISREYNLTLNALENAGGLEQLAQMVNTIKAAGAPLTEATREMMETAAAIQQSFKGLYDFVNSDAYRAITKAIASAASFVHEHTAELDVIQGASDRVKDLSLFLWGELKESGLSDKYTLQDVIEQGFDADGNTIDSPFREIIERAEKQLAEFEEAAETTDTIEQAAEILPQIKYRNSTEVKTVTDKFTNLFFSLTAPKSKGIMNGQRQFTEVRYEKKGAKKEITLFYDYSFNEDVIKRFGLSRNFDDQSFFVASIIDNLLDEGNNTVSLTKIWHELGNEGSPNTEALTNLVNILRLGMSTIITADVSQVSEAWEITHKGTNRELISPVIPVQIAHEKFAANGKTANAIINITGHTPFYLIGYPINHYTTWKKEILRLYTGRRTKRYYSVLRFLITQIGWMRNAKSSRSNKILYESLYEYTGDKGTRPRQLARDMMYRLFDEVFIPTGYISAYREDSTGKPGAILNFAQVSKIGVKKKRQ